MGGANCCFTCTVTMSNDPFRFITFVMPTGNICNVYHRWWMFATLIHNVSTVGDGIVDGFIASCDNRDPHDNKSRFCHLRCTERDQSIDKYRYKSRQRIGNLHIFVCYVIVDMTLHSWWLLLSRNRVGRGLVMAWDLGSLLIDVTAWPLAWSAPRSQSSNSSKVLVSWWIELNWNELIKFRVQLPSGYTIINFGCFFALSRMRTTRFPLLKFFSATGSLMPIWIRIEESCPVNALEIYNRLLSTAVLL